MPTIRHAVLPALFVLLSCAFVGAPAAAANRPPSTHDNGEIQRLLGDLCSRQVVLLGEDANHGSGRTLEIKAALVRRLIDDCGFDAVLFESQLYDFLALNRSFASQSATPAQLADAIGGLWSTTREIDPLVPYLFRQASSGRVKLFGLDPQVGGATGWFTQQHLPAQLAASLAPVRRKVCERTLLQLTRWQYDEATPYDEAARTRLRGCLAAIGAALASLPANTVTAQLQLQARNVSGYLAMADDTSGSLRDRLMYQNFQWFRAQYPQYPKIIIWTATVHAVKAGVTDTTATMPMGALLHPSLGQRAAVIGFSALAGSYARQGRPPSELSRAAVGTLEQRVMADVDGELQYVDMRQLDALGAITARPLNYGTPLAVRWSTLLDGLLVLREERPPDFVRKATPQQVER